MQALTRAADRGPKVGIYLDVPRWNFSPGPIAIGANTNNEKRVAHAAHIQATDKFSKVTS